MSYKILVTGGAGYIGSILIPKLLEAGFKVTAFDSFLFGGSRLLSFISNKNFSFIKGDVRDRESLSSAIKNYDLITHLAAIVGLAA
jgi:nucleoside-diphosphate-sugar epimerase